MQMLVSDFTMLIRKVRLKLDFWMNKLLMGHWSHLLSKTIESIQIIRPEIILQKRLVNAPEIIRYNFPDHYHSFFRRYRYFNERYVFKLSNIIFLRRKGVVLTKDYKILQESYGSLRRLYVWDDIKPFLTKSKIELFSEKKYYYVPKTGFYHFLLEEVPSLLHALSAYPDIKIIAYNFNEYPYYYHQLFNLLFQNKEKRIIEIDNNVLVKNGIITQRFLTSGGIPNIDIDYLNSTFGYLYKDSNKAISDKIYISRKNIKKRRIVNEVEIEEYLKTKRYKVIYLENMSLMQQIHLIGNAEYIIAPHGAGLSHIIWNPHKKKKIIEIFPSYQINDCYAGIAKMLNYDYNYIICETKSNMEYCDINKLKAEL